MTPHSETQPVREGPLECEHELSSSFDRDSRADPSDCVHFDDVDTDEEELESLVLGNKTAFRANLGGTGADEVHDGALRASRLSHDGKASEPAAREDLDDSDLFMFDTGAALVDGNQPARVVSDSPSHQDPEPAWFDSDDDDMTLVSLSGNKQLRKLRAREADDLVTGRHHRTRLRQYYLQLHPLPPWAKIRSLRAAKERSRSSAASYGSDSSANSDLDGDDEDTPALPMETFLRDAGALRLDSMSKKKRKFRPEVIDIQRTHDIPDTHKGPVGSISFHPQHPLLLSSSRASILYLHHINPGAKPIPNPQLTSVQVKSVPVRRSAFLHPNGDEIIFAGERRFFHCWNLSTGLVRRVNEIQGPLKEQRDMQRFRLSPQGMYMAIVATPRKGGGMLNIISVRSMQWIAQARLDSRGGIADFAWWRDGKGITILGEDGQLAEWSLATRRTVGIWKDEGSIGGTVMALGGRHGPSQVGGDRWVVVGSTSGVFNIYDRTRLVLHGEANAVGIKPLPTPTRSFEQLVTPVTVAEFSPDGQLLAIASQHKKDALKLVHLPSCTIYKNWPTEQTPLGRITAVAFGRSGDADVMAVGNDVGKIRLWEIRS